MCKRFLATAFVTIIVDTVKRVSSIVWVTGYLRNLKNLITYLLYGWWFEILVITYFTTKIIRDHYRSKALSKLPQGVEKEAWEKTLGTNLFFRVLDYVCMAFLLVGVVTRNADEATKQYSNVRTIFSAVFGPGIGSEWKKQEKQRVGEEELIEALDVTEIKPVGKEGHRYQMVERVKRMLFVSGIVLGAGLLAYFVWRLCKPVKKAQKHIDKQVRFSKFGHKIPPGDAPWIMSEGTDDDESDTESIDPVKREGTIKWKTRHRHIKDKYYSTTGDSKDWSRVNQDWEVHQYHPGKRQWVYNNYGSQGYWDALEAQKIDSYDHFQSNSYKAPDSDTAYQFKKSTMGKVERTADGWVHMSKIRKEAVQQETCSDWIPNVPLSHGKESTEPRTELPLKPAQPEITKPKPLPPVPAKPQPKPEAKPTEEIVKFYQDMRKAIEEMKAEHRQGLAALATEHELLNARIKELHKQQHAVVKTEAVKTQAPAPICACGQETWKQTGMCCTCIKKGLIAKGEIKQEFTIAKRDRDATPRKERGPIVKVLRCSNKDCEQPLTTPPPENVKAPLCGICLKEKLKKDKEARKSPKSPRRQNDKKDVLRVESVVTAKDHRDAVVQEALLGKPLNHGRFFPSVTEIRTFDGEKVKGVQGVQTRNLFVTVKHCGHGENETFQRAEGANQLLRAELKPSAVHPELDLCILQAPKTCAQQQELPMRAAVAGERVYLLHRTPEGQVIHQAGDIIDAEQHTCPTPNEGGLSGAPIFAESDHKMVGMHIGAFAGARKTNAYIPAEKIAAWIESLKKADSLPKN